MKFLKFLTCVSMLSIATFNIAHATTTNIDFKEDVASPDYKMAKMIFGEFIQRHPDIHLKVAEIDLNSDDVAELAIRLESNSTCKDNSCLTSVMMYLPEGWKEIFHHHTETLSLNGKPQKDSMLNLVQDNNILWKWDGTSKYRIDIASLGNFSPFGVNYVPAKSKVIIVASKELGIPVESGGWFATPINTGINGHQSWWVYCNSNDAEGSWGRSMALVAPVNGEWKVVLRTITGGDIAVLPTQTNNANDLAIMDNSGIGYWKWNGKDAYILTSTSYTSNVTPSP